MLTVYPGLVLEDKVVPIVEESVGEDMLDSGYEVKNTSVLGE